MGFSILFRVQTEIYIISFFTFLLFSFSYFIYSLFFFIGSLPHGS